MEKQAKPGAPSVYDVYELVEKCAKLFTKAWGIVEPYRVTINDPRFAAQMEKAAEDAEALQGLIKELARATEEAEPEVKAIARDIHRASAGLVILGETKASSVAEAVVQHCQKVCERKWPASVLKSRGHDEQNQRVLLARDIHDLELTVAKLNLEAARVVDLQERKGPDLSLLTDTERRVYSVVELYGPIDEAGINMVLYGHPKEGNSRAVATPMRRHGIFRRVADGYIVRRPGNIVRTDVN